MKAQEHDEHPKQKESKSGFLNDGPMFCSFPFLAFVINVLCLFLVLIDVCLFVIFFGGLGSWGRCDVGWKWGGGPKRGDNGLGAESGQ